MRIKLYRVLGALASKAYQDKYIVHGNADGYVLPEELLDDTEGAVRQALRHPQDFGLNETEIAALEKLLAAIKANSDGVRQQINEGAKKDLVHNNACWSVIRAEALQSFQALKFHFDAWEAENMDDTKPRDRSKMNGD
jgi:hypothetical protein